MKIRSGDYAAGAREAIRAAKTMTAVKYFDFASAAMSCMVQRRSYALIETCFPKLSLSDKQMVKREVAALVDTRQKMVPMLLSIRVLVADRGYGTESIDRFISSADYDNVHTERKLAAMTPQVSDDDTNLYDLFNDYRLGLTAAFDTNRMAKAIERES
jgi:hypothetical protein